MAPRQAGPPGREGWRHDFGWRGQRHPDRASATVGSLYAGPGCGGEAYRGSPHRGALISHVSARLVAPETNRPFGRFVRVELPGKEKTLSLAEVQVFDGTNNLARGGEASQSSTAYDAPARLAIDGNTSGDFEQAKSTTHTEASENPWWEVDLKAGRPIDRIVVWNRTDAGLYTRLGGFHLVVLDES